MRNELFTIGPFTAHAYGLFIGIGIIAAYIVSEFRAKRKGLDPEPIFSMTFFCVIGGFIGSKLLYFITILGDIMKDPSAVKKLADGWVVYGGIIGGILTAILFCKIKKMHFLKYFDLVIPAVALAQGFGRIGCLFAGCCYGLPTDGVCAITFTISKYAPNGIPLIPTQIISSVFDFALFFVLIFLATKIKVPGQIGALYLIIYSVGRFILEYMRGDLIRGSVGVLSTSQFISIFTVIAGILLFVITGRHYKKQQLEEGTEVHE